MSSLGASFGLILGTITFVIGFKGASASERLSPADGKCALFRFSVFIFLLAVFSMLVAPALMVVSQITFSLFNYNFASTTQYYIYNFVQREFNFFASRNICYAASNICSKKPT